MFIEVVIYHFIRIVSMAGYSRTYNESPSAGMRVRIMSQISFLSITPITFITLTSKTNIESGEKS